MDFSGLPDEIITLIAESLLLEDLVHFGQVSRLLQSLVLDPLKTIPLNDRIHRLRYTPEKVVKKIHTIPETYQMISIIATPAGDEYFINGPKLMKYKGDGIVQTYNKKYTPHSRLKDHMVYTKGHRNSRYFLGDSDIQNLQQLPCTCQHLGIIDEREIFLNCNYWACKCYKGINTLDRTTLQEIKHLPAFFPRHIYSGGYQALANSYVCLANDTRGEEKVAHFDLRCPKLIGLNIHPESHLNSTTLLPRDDNSIYAISYNAMIYDIRKFNEPIVLACNLPLYDSNCNRPSPKPITIVENRYLYLQDCNQLKVIDLDRVYPKGVECEYQFKFPELVFFDYKNNIFISEPDDNWVDITGINIYKLVDVKND